MPSCSRRRLKASRSAGSCSGKRQVRGLCAKSCTASIPNECAFSSAFLIPPEQWPPSSMGATLPEPGLEAAGLVLELPPFLPGEGRERLEHDPPALAPPEPGDRPVHDECLLHVAVPVNNCGPVLLREHAGA